VNPAKAAEMTAIPFRVFTQVGQGKMVIQIFTRERAILRAKRGLSSSQYTQSDSAGGRTSTEWMPIVVY